MLGQGRLVNLAAAEGHPPSVMDMSFATQALATEYCVQNKGKLGRRSTPCPVEVEEYVARHKLASMGITIDELTTEQKKYMAGWDRGPERTVVRCPWSVVGFEPLAFRAIPRNASGCLV